jgi:cation:H+ antiporter
MTAFIGIVAGIVLLIAGGAMLVRGAAEIADAFGISPMVVGLTIVGFGTSSPELVVNILGALSGETGLAFGNVVGSNISNLALVLGAAALMRPIALQGDVVRREVPLLLLATTMMTVMALDSSLEGESSVIGRIDSVILMLMFCIFIYITVQDVRRLRQKDRLLTDINETPVLLMAEKGRLRWLLVIAGIVALFFGGEMTVRNAVGLADQLGVSTTVVGLFVVAVGTSMPELATSMVAAARRESDLALGNIIGSNIFNSLVVLPVSGVVAHIPVPSGGIADLLFSWLLAALLIPIFVFANATLGRTAGALLVCTYVVYAILRIWLT